MKINMEAAVIDDMLNCYVKHKDDIILDLDESEFLEGLLMIDFDHPTTLTFDKTEYTHFKYISEALEELNGKA